jgi:hypothetical protein
VAIVDYIQTTGSPVSEVATQPLDEVHGLTAGLEAAIDAEQLSEPGRLADWPH